MEFLFFIFASDGEQKSKRYMKRAFDAANERDGPRYSADLGYFCVYLDRMAVRYLVKSSLFWSRDIQKGVEVSWSVSFIGWNLWV